MGRKIWKAMLLFCMMGGLLFSAGCGKEKAESIDAGEVCTISISCETLLDNPDLLDAEKAELVPEDGMLLPAAEVTFLEGESAFALLQRICKEEQIHLEFVESAPYGAYIQGIGNLYAGDAGDLSGWLYQVNGEMPNYAASEHQLQAGDAISWVYTCDGGNDVSGKDAE